MIDNSLIKKVLFADDDDDFRMTIYEYFSDKTSLVWEMAENGVVALDKALSTSFDLIILDIQMPFMKGTDTVKAIKIQSPDVCVIAFTGHCDPEKEEEFKQAGFDDIIKKPVSLEEFDHRIMQHLYSKKGASKPAAEEKSTPKPAEIPLEPKKTKASSSENPSVESPNPEVKVSQNSVSDLEKNNPDKIKIQRLVMQIQTLQKEKLDLQRQVQALAKEIKILKNQSSESDSGGSDVPTFEIE